MKAATESGARNHSLHLFQSTPPVKAATQSLFKTVGMIRISIHAAREGGDTMVEVLTDL